MVNLDIFNRVFELARENRPVLFSEIPEVLREDFNTFITGKTIVKVNDEWAAYSKDLKGWCRKLNTQGLDYSIDLNGTPRKITETK